MEHGTKVYCVIDIDNDSTDVVFGVYASFKDAIDAAMDYVKNRFFLEEGEKFIVKGSDIVLVYADGQEGYPFVTVIEREVK